jgi:cytochrome c556
MDKQELHTQLTHLHQELSTVENVDESTKAMLATVMQDIATLLTGEKPNDSESPAATSDSLREMVSEFEAEHPKLAQTLGQLADGLANLGI